MSRLLVLTALAVAQLLGGLPSASAGYFSTVVIDAGHGAHDLGAHNGRLFEKHLALDIARRLDRFLKRHGYRTVMTRTGDQFIPLDTRAAIGNRIRRSVFVSVHINHTRRSAPSGVETFYHSAEGRALASAVQRQIISNSRHGGDRGVRFARFRVLRTSIRPAILVEAGFLSNPRDRSRLRDPSYREAVAQSIGLGLIRFRRQ